MSREMQGHELFKAGEVSDRIERSVQTIGLWYQSKRRGYKVTQCLPEPVYIKGRRYFTEKDIKALIEFKDNLERGDMAPYNREHKWGKEGKKIQKRLINKHKKEVNEN